MSLIQRYWWLACSICIGWWILDSLVGIVLIALDWNRPLPLSTTLWEVSVTINILTYLTAIIVSIRIQLIDRGRMARIMIIPFILLTIFNIIIDYSEECQIYGITDTLTGNVVSNARTCFYFSVVTWTTLGYGDFRPTAALRLIAASEAILGYFAMALFVAGVVYVMGARRTADR
jgi:hypothetical protein